MNVSGILRRRIRIRSHTSGKSGPALLLERYEFAVDHSANGQSLRKPTTCSVMSQPRPLRVCHKERTPGGAARVQVQLDATCLACRQTTRGNVPSDALGRRSMERSWGVPAPTAPSTMSS
jgi:hypothetical protein